MSTPSGDKKNFFSYMELAKQELHSLLLRYPELGRLSTRELEVLSQLLTDRTQDQIARELFISSSAVHFHCKNIYKKLEVSGRRQILVKYKDI